MADYHWKPSTQANLRGERVSEDYSCEACGIWFCLNCGVNTPQVDRWSASPYLCRACGSGNGKMWPANHRFKALQEAHDLEAIDHLKSDEEARYPL